MPHLKNKLALAMKFKQDAIAKRNASAAAIVEQQQQQKMTATECEEGLILQLPQMMTAGSDQSTISQSSGSPTVSKRTKNSKIRIPSDDSEDTL
mmetsp:Transcript_111258/g.156187  ORF Transcript_111258/g.156187 Transcript_111258/m.156187 type:complete len:94 (+) Transcript_111258:3-284(+)